MSTLGLLIGILANNIFQSIWHCCILAEPKNSRKKTILIAAGTSAVNTCIALILCELCFQRGYISVGIFLGYVVELIIYAIMFCFVLSASHPVKSLFLFAGYYSSYTIILIVVSLVTNTFTLGNVWVWVLRAVFNLIVLIPYLLFFRERLFQMFNQIRSGYGIVTIIAIMCFLVQNLFWFYNMRLNRREIFFDVLLLASCGFTIMVYMMVFRYMAQSDHANRMKQLQMNEKFLQAQVDSYKRMGENAKQTRHDFRHHSMVVMEYAKNKDQQAILSYLSEYDEKEKRKYQEAFCNNRAADTVLSAYMNRCEQYDIEIKVDVWLDETEGVFDYDLVTILANILENAVNGCLEVEGTRKIDISVDRKGSKLVIVCKNTCTPDVFFEDGLPKNRERDGIGVESILSAAEKYSGVVDFSAADGIFVCQVILNNRRKHI